MTEPSEANTQFEKGHFWPVTTKDKFSCKLNNHIVALSKLCHGQN